MTLTNAHDKLKELFRLFMIFFLFLNLERLCEQKLRKTEYPKIFFIIPIIKIISEICYLA